MKLSLCAACALALIPAAATAQESTAVLKAFGDGTNLTAAQFEAFVQTELLATWDRNGSWPKQLTAALDQEEFAAGWLHVIGPAQPSRLAPRDLWPDKADAAFSALLATEGGGAEELTIKSMNTFTVFAKLARQRLIHHKQLAGSAPYSKRELDAYFKKRAALVKTKSGSARASKLLEQLSKKGQIEQIGFLNYAAMVRLWKADADGSGTLDPAEFVRAFESDVTPTARYRAWAKLVDNTTYLVSASEAAPTIDREARRILAQPETDAMWEALNAARDESVSLSRVRSVIDKAKEEKDHKATNRVFAPGMLLFDRPPTYKGESYAPDNGLFLKVRSNVRVPDSSAQPATVSWKKGTDEETLSVNGAVGLEWSLTGEAKDHSILVATRWSRSKVKSSMGTTDTDDREYYVGYGLTLADHFLRVGIVREEVHRMDITRNALGVDWFPRWGRDWYGTGRWNAITEDVLEFNYQPAVTLDLGDYEDDNNGMANEIPSQSRVELNIGFRLFEKLTLQTRVGVLTDLEQLDRSFLYHESSLSYPIFGKDNITLTATAKTGRDSPTLDRVEEYEIGFGVKF